jgi:hypothetical protein
MSDDDPIVFADADEARAWDRYFSDSASCVSRSAVTDGARHYDYGTLENHATFADAMLRERRKRMRCQRDWCGDRLRAGELCTLPRGHNGTHYCEPTKTAWGAKP